MKDIFADDVAPQTVQKKLLEKDIQKTCVDWARNRGWWARKFSSPANRSVPDYLFSRAGNGKFFSEFKAPKKKATDAQLEEQRLMRIAGWIGLQECDGVAMFKEFVLALETC